MDLLNKNINKKKGSRTLNVHVYNYTYIYYVLKIEKIKHFFSAINKNKDNTHMSIYMNKG